MMLGITLDRQSAAPLKRQIYQQLKARMISGRLAADDSLPSTRELAQALKVSRNTVCEAYDMLLAEGYAVSRPGAATRVAQGVQMETPPVSMPQKPRPVRRYAADFRTGQPDLAAFPRHAFEQALLHSARNTPLPEWGYTGPQGLPVLRQEIAAWLYRSRGLVADPEDIFITAGATHALHLIAGILHARNSRIIVEDPCHIGMRQTLLRCGYTLAPVAVDEHGIRTDRMGHMNAGAVYVTPSHQFPLGGILPAGRRAELIRYARERDAYIIEDDYDSEFRYGGETISPLAALDGQRVIYVGTFSKVLYPALRIGYVILPRRLQKLWRVARTYADVQNPVFEQAALAELMNSRKLDGHIRQMRKLYGRRRQALVENMADVFRDAWRPCGDAAGLHMAAAFAGRRFGADFPEKCRSNGIYVASVAAHCIESRDHDDKLLLGYGHLGEDEIGKGVLLLRDVMGGEAEE
jgi:GntR family transcriptional regulator/MocR family aminotransferase